MGDLRPPIIMPKLPPVMSQYHVMLIIFELLVSSPGCFPHNGRYITTVRFPQSRVVRCIMAVCKTWRAWVHMSPELWSIHVLDNIDDCVWAMQNIPLSNQCNLHLRSQGWSTHGELLKHIILLNSHRIITLHMENLTEILTPPQHSHLLQE